MQNASSVLFVIACFTFCLFTMNYIVKLFNGVISAITDKSIDEPMNLEVIGASLSFAYILTYLFVW